MNIGYRDLQTIIKAPFKRTNYAAALGMIKNCPHPVDAFVRYIGGGGIYPVKFPLRTPTGPIAPTIYSHEDMLTINEIFFRGDYACPSDIRTIVDFGSNIGLSALYFLSRNNKARCYLFEPLAVNAARLNHNLYGLTSRYELEQVAVGLSDGTVDFGTESSGRLGGIGLTLEGTVQVPCRHVTTVLEGILGRERDIDILKIDIQALERELLAAVPISILRRIRQVFIEQIYQTNPYPGLYHFQQYGSVARFTLYPK
jgi:FkbM family methyltransferase